MGGVLRRAVLRLLLPLVVGLLLAPGAGRAEDDTEEGDGFEAFRRAPAPAEAPGPDADLFVRGVELQREGKYRAARRVFWKLIDEHPESPYAPEADDRSSPNAFLGVRCMHDERPSARRIDVALMGDGYTLDHQDRFDKDAVGHLKVFLGEPVYDAYEPYFNFWKFNLASKDTGVDEVERLPVDEEEAERQARRRKKRPIREFSTALDCKAAGPQGQVMANPRRVWHYLSYLDVNDALAIVFAKKGELGMGGMGIATTGPKGVVVHEFGHAFGGLLDEYANNPGEPFGVVESANTTTNRQNPPWKHFLEARIPGVGVYEGAATYQQGVWRPAPSCAMNTGGSRYCPVCREATVLMIYTYVSPIDVVRPPTGEIVLGEEGWPAFGVLPMQPNTHRLEVEFFLGAAPQPTDEEPVEGATTEEESFADELLTDDEQRIWERIRRRREQEGKTVALPTFLPIQSGRVRRTVGTGKDDAPAGVRLKSRRRKESGVGTFVEPVLGRLEPGRYLLTGVVRDPARPKGSKHAWVLKDDRGLLEDRCSWILVVPPPEAGPPR